MQKNNPKILFKNHFKIYVLQKNKILFDAELEKQNIEYYCDVENQPNITHGIRYFIQETDRIKVDKIFIENEIIANTETTLISDYRDEKKVQILYLKVGVIVFGIMILILIINSLVK